MSLRCPHCGAPLDEGILATFAEGFDCPECDRPVRLDELQAGQTPEQQPDAETAVSDREAAPSEQPISDADEQASWLISPGAAPAEEPISDTPPPGRLQCVQKDSQLIILILPGSNRAIRSLGCFTICWLSLLTLITVIFLRIDPAAGNEFLAGVLFLLLGLVVLSVFWIVGLVLLYSWLSGRFGKTYVLVEPDRVVVRYVLFGRERFREYPLDRTSHAKLVESYKENEQPIYAIAITTTSGALASFGTFLSDDEKQWLVARINRHLGVANAAGPKPTRPRREECDKRPHPMGF